MSDFKDNIIEAVTLVSLISAIGFASKKILKKTMTSDPSNSFMNAIEFCGVMLGAIYAKNYLKKEKLFQINVI